MLDINLENMGVDGDMNWGIPLINAGYSVEKILNQFGDMGFVNYRDNGDYYFEYTVPKREYLNVADFSKLPNAEQTFLLDFPISLKSSITLEHTFEGNNIDISTEEMKVRKATLESGQIKFDFSQISIPSEIDYDAHITSNTLFNADGSKFVKELSKNNPIVFANCVGLKVETENSQLDFDITITLRTSEIPSIKILPFNPKISLINVTLKEAEIELLKEYSHPVTVATAFSVFPQNLSLDVTLHNPMLTFDFTNTFGFDISMIISKAYLKGSTHIESILLKDNTPIIIPGYHTGPVNISQYIKDELRLISTYDSLVFEFVPFITEGVVTIRDNSTLAAGVNFSIPFDIQIDQAVFNDTLAFNLPGLSGLSILDVVTIRTAFESSIPSDFSVQIWLYNSTTQTMIDSLLSKPAKIRGSYTGTLVPTDAQYISITNDRITKLQEADKMILQLSLNTNGQHKPFNQRNSLRARVGAHIKTATEF